MAWERTRPARAPATWLPFVAVAALVGLTGFLGERWLAQHLAELARLAESDPSAGRAAAERMLRALRSGVAVFALVAGVLFAWLCARALQEGRMPPAGAWSLGAVRVATGATARHLALAGFGVAAALVGAGIALLAWGARPF